MKQNPWLGLASYDEQAVAQGYKFCGRERAVNELYSIIDSNLFTTLYGKSGIGKSSLLQAGVFPRLRDENYLPVMIRLGVEATATCNYSILIIEAVRNAILEANGQCICSQESEAVREEERLWRFFHTTEFQDSNGDALFPVIVLDQFEELYYKNKRQLNTLLKSLYLLVDDSSLPMSNDSDAANYRVVLSIREDDLFHLEDSIDKLRLTEMKYNRYRLRELTDDEARNVILQPGVELFNPEEAEAISDYIIQESKAGNEEISTAVLSLVCSRIYYMHQSAFTYDATEPHITLSQITGFFRQAEGNFLKSFYDDIIKELKSPVKWYYIEDVLVTDEGRRNSVLKSEFDRAVPNSEFLFKGDKSMLRYIATAGTGEPRVEIIHDMLARQMMSSRNERKLQAQAKALRKQRITAVVIILLAIVLGIVFYTQYRSIVAERNSMQKMQSHYIAEKAESLIEKGKSTLAVRLLLTVLPENLDKPNRPYVVEAESSLRRADNALRHLLQFVKLNHKSDLVSADFSPNGEYVITAHEDRIVRIWCVETGEEVWESFKHDDKVNFVHFSPDGFSFVITSRYGGVHVWDTRTKELIRKINNSGFEVVSSQSSNNGRFLVVMGASDAMKYTVAEVWDITTGKLIDRINDVLIFPGDDKKKFSFLDSEGKGFVVALRDSTFIIRETRRGGISEKKIKVNSGINSVQVSPDGTLVVVTSGDGTTKIWDVQTGAQVGKTMTHGGELAHSRFSMDGKYVVTASLDGTNIWDVETGMLIRKINYYSSTIRFSPDGKYLVTGRCDIWSFKDDGDFLRPIGIVDAVGVIMDLNLDSDKGLLHIIDDEGLKSWKIGQRPKKYFLNGEGGNVKTMNFSLDGRYFIVARESSKKVRICATRSHRIVDFLISSNTYVNYVALNSDGTYALVATKDSTASVWNVKGAKKKEEVLEHDDEVLAAEFSPDGRFIITLTGDGTAVIWDAHTYTRIGKEFENVCGFDFSPNGKQIVIVFTDNTATIWETQTWRQIGKDMRHNSRLVDVKFDRSGEHIMTVSEDGCISMWKINENIRIKQINGDLGYFLELSPDGKYYAAGYPLRICDAETDKEVVGLNTSWLFDFVKFSPDGKHVLVASRDGVLQIIDFLPLRELIDKCREVFHNSPLTEEELMEFNFK